MTSVTHIPAITALKYEGLRISARPVKYTPAPPRHINERHSVSHVSVRELPSADEPSVGPL